MSSLSILRRGPLPGQAMPLAKCTLGKTCAQLATRPATMFLRTLFSVIWSQGDAMVAPLGELVSISPNGFLGFSGVLF